MQRTRNEMENEVCARFAHTTIRRFVVLMGTSTEFACEVNASQSNNQRKYGTGKDDGMKVKLLSDRKRNHKNGGFLWRLTSEQVWSWSCCKALDRRRFRRQKSCFSLFPNEKQFFHVRFEKQLFLRRRRDFRCLFLILQYNSCVNSYLSVYLTFWATVHDSEKQLNK